MQNKQTYFLHCYVAGLQYYEAPEVYKKLEVGQKVQFIPESNNPYNEYAVVAFSDNKLGYLPRKHNRVVCQILQAGHDDYEARIQSSYTKKTCITY